MKIRLNTRLRQKDYYEESDFPVGTFNGVKQTAQLITSGKHQNREYRTFKVKAPQGAGLRAAKTGLALLITGASLGFGMFSPYVRKLWKDVRSDTITKTIKVLVPLRKVNLLAPLYSKKRSPKKLFSDLKKLLTATKRDEQKIKRTIAEIEEIKSDTFSDRKRSQFMALINEIRTPLIQHYNQNLQNRVDNPPADREILNGLNSICYKFAKIEYVRFLGEHFNTFVSENSFAAIDGHIVPSNAANPTNATITIPLTAAEQGLAALPGYNPATRELTIKAEHVPSLHQGNAQNQLCSWYALFCVMQSIKGRDLNDRKAFMDFCHDALSKKVRRFVLSDMDHREHIADTMRITENATALAPVGIDIVAREIDVLANNDRWFVLDNTAQPTEPERALGMNIDMNIYPESRHNQHREPPLFFVYQAGTHYYFAKVEIDRDNQLKFTVSHSLEYNLVSGRRAWGDWQWRNLLNYVAHIMPAQRNEQTNDHVPPSPRPR